MNQLTLLDKESLIFMNFKWSIFYQGNQITGSRFDYRLLSKWLNRTSVLLIQIIQGDDTIVLLVFLQDELLLTVPFLSLKSYALTNIKHSSICAVLWNQPWATVVCYAVYQYDMWPRLSMHFQRVNTNVWFNTSRHVEVCQVRNCP